MTANLKISNGEFLSVLFGSHLSHVHVTAFPGDPYDPAAPRGRWFGKRWGSGGEALLSRDGWNQYYCVSTFALDKDGKASRKHSLCERLHVLIIDDVGDGKGGKITPERVEQWFVDNVGAMIQPTAIIETSPGSCQYVYGFKTPFEGLAYASMIEEAWTAVTKQMNPTGKDPGNGDTTRYVRPPNGINGKSKHRDADGNPPRVVLKSWNPERLFVADKWAEKVLKKTQEEIQEAKSGVFVSSVPRGSTPVEYDDPAQDPTGWGKALQDRGLLIETSKQGVWDITCPWIDKHTDRVDTGTAYLGNGAFNCFHGNCADKTPDDFRGFYCETYPEIADEIAAHVFKNTPIDLGDDDINEMMEEVWVEKGWKRADLDPDQMVERFVWLPYDDTWFDLETRKTVSKSSFDTTYGGLIRERLEQAFAHKVKGARPSASTCMAQAPGLKKASAVEYAPGMPPFFEDPERTTGGHQFFVANTYAAPTLGTGVASRMRHITLAREQKVMGLFFKLVEQLVGETGDVPLGMDNRMYNWLALMVANPSVKPRWQWLITSRPAFGKDTLANILGRLVGEDNWIGVDTSAVSSGYTEWAAKKFILVNELSPVTSGRKQGIDLFDHMKPFLTTPPFTVRINPKYGKKYDARNVGGYMFFSNHDLPLILDASERRLCAVDRLDAKNEIKEAGLWTAIYDELVNNPIGLEIVGLWLRERYAKMPKAQHDDLMGAAPETETKSRMIEASVGKYDELVNRWINDDEGLGSLWTNEQLRQRLQEDTRHDKALGGLTMARLGYMLRKAGAWRPYDHADRQGRVLGVGVGQHSRQTVWALYEIPEKGLVRNAKLTMDEIRDLLTGQSTARGDNVVPFKPVSEGEAKDLLNGLDTKDVEGSDKK